VSHAGAALLRELAEETGLVAGWTAALIDTYSLPPTHAPGQVLVDLAVTIADGGDALRHLRALRDQAKLFGPVASDPTAWRVVDRVDAVRLGLLRRARAAAREGAWAAGAGPDLSEELRLVFDASLVAAHSEKEDAGPTWK
jgi:8-oxo-dGTP pyrophosphatase MutT (NUDIX family)